MAKRREGNISSTNEFECPHCGATVFQDLLACPNCGRAIYPEDSDVQEISIRTPQPSRRWFSFSAVIAGWLVSGAIVFSVNLIAARLWTPSNLSRTGEIFLLIGPTLGAFIGGFLAGKLATQATTRQSVMAHGLLVTVLSVLNAYLIETYWTDLVHAPPRPLAMAGWGSMLITGLLGAYLQARRRTAGSPAARIYHKPADLASLVNSRETPSAGLSNDDQLYLELLSRVEHDFAVADRLVEMERGRNPSGTPADWIRSAIEHWDQ